MAKSGTPQSSLPLVEGMLIDTDTDPMPRRHPRFSLALRVRSMEHRRAAWTSVDLSEGGLFVKGPPLFAAGSCHTLQIGLPKVAAAGPVICQAQVAWTNGPGQRKKPAYPCGMGLRFITLTSGARRALQDFLQQCRPAASIATALDRPRASQPAIKMPLPAASPPPSASPPPIELVQPVSAPTAGKARVPHYEILRRGTELGAYRIIELLGAGSMGQVYVGEHRVLGRRVAIKRLCRKYADDPELVGRFFAEARRMSQLRHPNVVDVVDFVDVDGERAYVMELLGGNNLSQLLVSGQPLALRRALTIGQQLCDALTAVHSAGIVHRDVKPANIFLVDCGTRHEQVKLLDFGVSRFVDLATGRSDNGTASGALLGTPGYLAPEQISNSDVDQRADLYALGVVFYQLVTGRKPFAADSWPQLLLLHATQPPTPPSALTPQPLPPQLEALILRCLDKEPARRPATALEVRAELEQVAETLDAPSSAGPSSAGPSSAGPLTAPAAPQVPVRRWWYRQEAALGVLLVLSLLALLVWLVALYR